MSNDPRTVGIAMLANAYKDCVKHHAVHRPDGAIQLVPEVDCEKLYDQLAEHFALAPLETPLQKLLFDQRERFNAVEATYDKHIRGICRVLDEQRKEITRLEAEQTNLITLLKRSSVRKTFPIVKAKDTTGVERYWLGGYDIMKGVPEAALKAWEIDRGEPC